MAEPRRRSRTDAPLSQQQADWQARSDRERRGTRWVAVSLLAAIAAGIGLLVLYVQGGQTQAEGVLIFLAFGSVGLALGIWVRVVIGPDEVVEPRYPMASTDEERSTFSEVYERAVDDIGGGTRRRFLGRLLAAAAATLGLAIAFPLRSLGPGPAAELFRTAWRPGARLVDLEGHPIRLADVAVDQAITVFPEHAPRSADSQAFLIGTRSDAVVVDELPEQTAPGTVCYSKICTHAGCPVGLYRAQAGELLCPCHQSTFDVNRGAAVKSGPAGRPLPQLPITVDEEGFLVALGDFAEPVGPSFWNMTRDVPAESADGDEVGE
ncbi:MAG: Rieske (2Fe-2S) protein [Nitriliruptorales bacterium]|nr:Rieske (2Fe-2S) protein [Nitriliruptorales bacterium]